MPRKQFVVCTDQGSGKGRGPQVFMQTGASSLTSSISTSTNTIPHHISVFAGVRVSHNEALVDTAAEDAVIGDRAQKL